MARETLTVQAMVRAGLTAGYTAFEASGVAFANEGRTFIHVKNAQAAGTTKLTIITPNTVDGLAIDDRDVTIAAATEEFIGPFQPGVYNQSTDVVHIDVTTATSVSIAAIRI
ncbi:MAG TPA: hypothetical protein VMX14_03800 [Anaerolineae bacterium]|nr:hypothetical protein [Anaerolineae bacterium]HUW11279.1 hypothetical protein [Anaerolineae bacterium]